MLGHPILGDHKYWDRRAAGPYVDAEHGLMLSAVALELPHPRDGRTVRVCAQAPVEARTAALMRDVRASRASAEPTAARQRLALVEEVLPKAAPDSYEARLRDAVAARGDVVRWAITQVGDETVTAEAVILLPTAARDRR